MSDPYGYYNKYIFNNNSYLKTYLVRETVKNNYRKKNLNSLIDNNLRKNYYPYVKNIKKTNMVDKIDRLTSEGLFQYFLQIFLN